MQIILIGEIGQIIFGDHAGNFIRIEDDSENTGGFLVLISPYKDFRPVYDDWVESQESLYKYFQQSQWIVNWL
ncbi:MAG: hypothetical protein EOO69_07660 [Moraxellaceae bacterium]|nr:MAG: hypothetical protein EOO69_07660 [Moraxellaceae bacterium]